MSATNRGSKRNPRDYYVTEHWCCDALAQDLRDAKVDTSYVIDLGAGDGRIGSAVGRPGYVCNNFRIFLYDIEPQNHHVKKMDIIAEKHPLIMDHLGKNTAPIIIVSNPAFSLAQEFIDIGIQLASATRGVAAFLLPMSILGSDKRHDWWQKNPCQSKTILSTRPSFTKAFLEAVTPENEQEWWCSGCEANQLLRYTKASGLCSVCGKRVLGGTDAQTYAWFWWDYRPRPRIGDYFVRRPK